MDPGGLPDGLNQPRQGREALTVTPLELPWVAIQPYLKDRGYQLRPRYRQGWRPSWAEPSATIRWQNAEDGILLPPRRGVIDAIRISDGKLVYVKEVGTASQELKIARYLSSEEKRHDPTNPCFPLLDVLEHPTATDRCLMVMPFLRYIDNPGFETVRDVLECGERLLEGLVYLHDNNIAHRDCAYKNVMMDATALYPKGFHPILQSELPDVSAEAPVLSRTLFTVKYYFVDFGISTQFRPGEQRLVTGTSGLDDSVPELSDTIPYDPFKVDIYLLGNVFRRVFLRKFANVAMLRPLVQQMTHEDPAARPEAAAALQEWKAIRASTSSIKSWWRLRPSREVYLLQALRDVRHLFFLLYVLTSRPRVAPSNGARPRTD